MSTAEENKQLVRKLFKMQASGDMQGILEIYDSAYMHYIAGSTSVSGTTRGFEELMEKLGPVMGLIDGPVEIELGEMVAEGEWVVAIGKGKGKGKTGLAYNNEYVFWYRIRDGKIVESREYGDTALVETALFGKKLVDPDS